MAIRTLTAANSVYLLQIPGLYDTYQKLQGYAADAAFATEASVSAEVVVGVDGKVSAGYTPYLTPQSITLQPDSESSDIFENWIQAQDAVREVLYANALVSLPGSQREYSLTQGYLTSVMKIPGTAKILQARPFTITWAAITSAPL